MNDKVTKWDIIQAMRMFGGSFARALADAYDKADLDNQRRIENAFPEMWEEYTKMAEYRLGKSRG